MLNLNYSPEVPQALRDHMEFHARRIGLPLHELEEVGQSLARAEAFILAAEAGHGLDFLREPAPRTLPPRDPAPALRTHSDSSQARA